MQTFNAQFHNPSILRSMHVCNRYADAEEADEKKRSPYVLSQRFICNMYGVSVAYAGKNFGGSRFWPAS